MKTLHLHTPDTAPGIRKDPAYLVVIQPMPIKSKRRSQKVADMKKAIQGLSKKNGGMDF